MEKENIARAWFSAVRSAADEAVQALTKAYHFSRLQQIETKILLRQELYDDLPEQMAKTERISMQKAQSMCEGIYPWLIEDVLSETIGDPGMAAQVSSFLRDCADGVSGKDIFWDLFRRIFSPVVMTEQMRDDTDMILLDMDLGLRVWMRERAGRFERKRDPSEPPPDLDEFEYIDWIMTH